MIYSHLLTNHTQPYLAHTSVRSCKYFQHVAVKELQSLHFPTQLSQHNTLTCEGKEPGEPWLHRIKWYHDDQCALTSRVLGCPPLG